MPLNWLVGAPGRGHQADGLGAARARAADHLEELPAGGLVQRHRGSVRRHRGDDDAG